MRPSKLTKTVQENICDALSIGCTLEIAATYGGVSYSTLNNWRKLGIDAQTRRESGNDISSEDKKYLKFLQAIDGAINAASIRYVEVIDNAAAIDPKWAAYMLERRGVFLPPTQRNQTQTLNIDVTKLSDEQLERIANGEDAYAVLATTGNSGDRATATDAKNEAEA